MSDISIRLTVNGQPVSASLEPRTSLADFLREACRTTSVHLGCEHGVCGACTVLIDGQPGRSCIALAASCEGASVTTLEGLAEDGRMQAIQAAFQAKHGLQCGFCTPGMLITAWDMIGRGGGRSEAAVRDGLSGNLCRCTGYQGIVRSVLEAARVLGGGPAQE